MIIITGGHLFPNGDHHLQHYLELVRNKAFKPHPDILSLHSINISKTFI
jgi:hypothetical protein